jgi:hypothetical protein
MQDVILVGRGNKILSVPAMEFREAMQRLPAKMKARLAFMTPVHHLVRDYVVRELPRGNGRPIKPTTIAKALRLSLSQTVEVLDELEKRLFFLVRNANGDVNWAFPVTSERTPHLLRFSTGERVSGA